MDVADGPAEYCRQIESYLCRKNGGHLIRIVGPAFEQVCGWAVRGVPLSVAHRGIDRCCERHQAKRSRRPVRIEFCEADVLDVFDEWRKSIGLARLAESTGEGAVAAATSLQHASSLPTHVDRLITRLTTLRVGAARALDRAIDDAVRELDRVRAGARTARGEKRERLLGELKALDAALLARARDACDPATLEQIDREAEAELVRYRDRMPATAYEQALVACRARLLQERWRLPGIAYE